MDLEWILKCLNNESLLDEDSKYMCDICRSKQEAKIYTQYTEMPNILVFHLLPFGIVSSRYFLSLIIKIIDFYLKKNYIKVMKGI